MAFISFGIPFPLEWSFGMECTVLPMHDMVIVEHLTGSEQVEDENESYKYFTAFRAVTERALSERESLRLIRKYQAEKWPAETAS